jgi:hypothetical protein
VSSQGRCGSNKIDKRDGDGGWEVFTETRIKNDAAEMLSEPTE